MNKRIEYIKSQLRAVENFSELKELVANELK